MTNKDNTGYEQYPRWTAWTETKILQAESYRMAQEKMTAAMREQMKDMAGINPFHTGKSKVDAARERFGQKFCAEQGSTWKPREIPSLTEWFTARKTK